VELTFNKHRFLSNNNLTGPIPPTIAQLTALTLLYAVKLTILCRSSPALQADVR
jgi:hypothetical protein